MKITLITTLLLFSLTANADHHRTHAIGQLELALSQVTRAQAAVESFRLEYTPPAALSPERAYSFLEEQVVNQLAYVLDDINYMHDVLSDPDTQSVTLLELRDLLNKPYKDSQPQSTLYRYGVVIHLLQQYIVDNPNAHLAESIKRTKSAWEYTEFVLWHINDGIIEELYELKRKKGKR